MTNEEAAGALYDVARALKRRKGTLVVPRPLPTAARSMALALAVGDLDLPDPKPDLVAAVGYVNVAELLSCIARIHEDQPTLPPRSV